MLYGRHPALPPILYSLVKESEGVTPQDYMKALTQTLIKIQTTAYSNLLIKKVKSQEKANEGRRNLEEFEVGDQVMFSRCGNG